MPTTEKNRVARPPGAIRADIQAYITRVEPRLACLDTDAVPRNPVLKTF
jgi:hypothetical protein